MSEEKVPTVIRVRCIRHGPNGRKYAACNDDGSIICCFDRLANVRRRWKWEIKNGLVVLVRELDKKPDMRKLNAMKAAAQAILRSYGYKFKGV